MSAYSDANSVDAPVEHFRLEIGRPYTKQFVRGNASTGSIVKAGELWLALHEVQQLAIACSDAPHRFLRKLSKKEFKMFGVGNRQEDIWTVKIQRLMVGPICQDTKWVKNKVQSSLPG